MFGPNEIRRSRRPSRPTTTTSARCATPPTSSPSRAAARPRPRPGWASCQYLIGRYSDAIQTLTNADGGALTHFYLGKAYLALDKYAEALTAYESAERAGYNRDDVALAKAEAMRYKGDAAGSLKVLDNLSGAVEQTAEYLYQRSADRRGPGRQPDRSRSPCWSGPSTPTRRTRACCSAWPCENDRARQRRLRPPALRAGRQAVPHARRHAAQPGPAVRGHRALRAGQAVLPADSRRVPRRTSGPGCTSRTPTPRATCTTTRKPAAARIGCRRSSACRSPTSSCRSAAAIACKRWAS